MAQLGVTIPSSLQECHDQTGYDPVRRQGIDINKGDEGHPQVLKSHDRLSAGLKTSVNLNHPVRVVCLRERILPRPLTGKVEGSYADVDARPATRIFRVTLIFDTTR